MDKKLYNIVFCCVIRCPTDWMHMIYQTERQAAKEGKRTRREKQNLLFPRQFSLEDKLS